MASRLITLTTDFGQGSPYVAQMKGVLLAIHPQVSIVDISHTIAPQDVLGGALVLAETCHHFPRDTIHVAVVDPGVGTSRSILAARIGDHTFVAPDNGLLSVVAKERPLHSIVRLENREFWRAEVSHTFHGRDIMAPVAAHLSQGVACDDLGPCVDEMVELEVPSVQRRDGTLQGTVLAIDSFGNLVTNIRPDLIPGDIDREKLRITCGSADIQGMTTTYGSHRPGTIVALIGSSDRLELAVVQGSAASVLQATVGFTVNVQWDPQVHHA
jgi:S-adenosylmethionine hydrolase